MNGVLYIFSTGGIVPESSDGSKSTLHVRVCCHSNADVPLEC